MYCGLSTASEVFLIFTTQLYQYLSVFVLFALFSDASEVFLPKYSQTAKLHAAHFPRVVNTQFHKCYNQVTRNDSSVDLNPDHIRISLQVRAFLDVGHWITNIVTYNMGFS